VEVDHASTLVFGHSAERQPNHLPGLDLGEPQDGRQLAMEVDGGPAPQLGGVGVVEDRASVVVAVGTDRSPDQLVILVVMLRTVDQPAVGTPMARRSRPAESALST
jgi:hypothetical protein